MIAALLDAVEQGNFEAVQRLLETNATPELLNMYVRSICIHDRVRQASNLLALTHELVWHPPPTCLQYDCGSKLMRFITTHSPHTKA